MKDRRGEVKLDVLLDFQIMTDKQKALLVYARANDNKITKKEAVKLIGHHYYHNASKYVGEILSRMVNAGTLTRIKQGSFQLGTGTPFIENQIELL